MDQSTSMWTVVGTHEQKSRALMAMAHAALVANREGLKGLKFEDFSRDDAWKGIKISAAFTALYSGLCGYFEPNPNEVVYS